MEFYKLSGSGNDFIIVNNIDNAYNGYDWSALALRLCQRRVSVGADGLIVLVSSEQADFKWLFYNADGSMAAMCGNGGRCAARLAHYQGIAGKVMSFETGAGIIDAQILDEETVKIRLTAAHSYQEDIPLVIAGTTLKVGFINTGVPHVICFVEDLARFDVVGMGRAIRRHERFAPAGVNANFISINDGFINVRTYERGVEDETLACGTGAVASALLAIYKGLSTSPVSVRVRSGEVLKVHYDADNGGKIYLEGGAKLIYRGKAFTEALR